MNAGEGIEAAMRRITHGDPHAIYQTAFPVRPEKRPRA